MPRNPRVDAYIAKASDFAKPILKQIRAAVHKGHPPASETIKWGVPAYVDDKGILCMTAAFKHHCAWVFWTGRKPASVDAKSLRRITSVKELPAQRALVALVKEAATHAVFNAFPPSHRREYVDWVDSAKTDETRQRRLATAIEWISSGKSRNWKYER